MQQTLNKWIGSKKLPEKRIIAEEKIKTVTQKVLTFYETNDSVLPHHQKSWKQGHTASGRAVCKLAKIRFAMKKRGEQHKMMSRSQYEKLIRQECYYCGRRGEAGINGIDRISPQLGYILSNCRPCCEKCNHAKFLWTEEVMIETARLIVKKADEREAAKKEERERWLGTVLNK